jgi:protein-L-isoaspartate(D-aspartate) O-methyltransferase
MVDRAWREGLPMMLGAAALGLACSRAAPPETRAPGATANRDAAAEIEFRERRERLVEFVRAQGVDDPAVLAAVRAVPRHRFVPPVWRDRAYDDTALPIAAGQTISQPSLVALMTARLRPRPGLRVLEIGTGSGYQAAILAECAGPKGEVDTIEIVPALGHAAAALLRDLGYRTVRVRIGDGYAGWPERAPFDAIILTAAAPRVPQPLLDQLKVGGRLVAPVGREGDVQTLVVITRTEQGFTTEAAADVRFVPMTGRAQAAPDR